MECRTTVVTPPTEADSAPTPLRDPFTLVIFGASGDLASRKLIPALVHLEQSGFLPEHYAIVGLSRTEMTDDAYRESMATALTGEGLDGRARGRLLGSLAYVAGDGEDPQAFERLEARIREIERARGLPGNRLYYLSVAPQFFATIIGQLAAHRMIRGRGDATWSRVIIEKPFGRDLESARQLNAQVLECLDESQIYRIDHYLGKETVQNILAFRFGNSIFEPLFNHNYVEHVQLTVAETLGMEGRRGAYYDHAGALRDMVQNHMLQLVCLTAMEPPSAMDGQAIRDEKVKVLRAIEPMTSQTVSTRTVRGQYEGYRDEAGVQPGSTTESYVALRLSIDNWRWAGVPFYLRMGKRLCRRVSEIAITFKQPPLHLFRELADCRPRANVLVLRIHPDEGIELSFASKQPGMRMRLDDVRMDFSYRDFQKRSPEAYERLILDALRGDASLFTRSDEVTYAWRFITSIHEGWATLPPPSFPNYRADTDGPADAHRLFAGWRSLRERS